MSCPLEIAWRTSLGVMTPGIKIKSFLCAYSESSWLNPGDIPNLAPILFAKSISDLVFMVPIPRLISGKFWNSSAISYTAESLKVNSKIGILLSRSNLEIFLTSSFDLRVANGISLYFLNTLLIEAEWWKKDKV